MKKGDKHRWREGTEREENWSRLDTSKRNC